MADAEGIGVGTATEVVVLMTPTERSRFALGTTITPTASFFQGGDLTTPHGEARLYWRAPDGSEASNAGEIVSEGVAAYSITLNSSGVWWLRWRGLFGDDDSIHAVAESSIIVDSSPIA